MLRPLGGRVIVKQDKLDETDPVYRSAKAAGVVFVDTDDRKREEQAVVKGTIVAIGDMAFKEPVGDGTPWVKVGDRVYFAKYAGKIIVDPETDEEFLALNDEDLVIAITGEKQ